MWHKVGAASARGSTQKPCAEHPVGIQVTAVVLGEGLLLSPLLGDVQPRGPKTYRGAG